MRQVEGTKGYEKVVDRFAQSTYKLSFENLHVGFLPFIPKQKSHILDVGAGIGRDAHEFWIRGHEVVAVEPLQEFRLFGKKTYVQADIAWIDDSLPALSKVLSRNIRFDLIWASGVWHHLNPKEQQQGLQSVSKLLKPKGRFVLSLRNGPAGAGCCVYPTDVDATLTFARLDGMTPLLVRANQPSKMKHKERVKWAYIVLEKE